MTPRLLLAVALLALSATGCGDKKPPPRAAARPQPAAQPTPPTTLAAAQAPAPEWTYTSVGKRDPFRNQLGDVAPPVDPQQAANKCTTPLGRFELEQLRLVAVITGLDDPVAMVEAPNGIGYALRRGACIGRNGGVISVVRTGEVVVSESVLRPDGTRERAQTLLRLPREAALNIEE